MKEYGYERIKQQIAYEDEGGAAGAAGKTRDDCPYNQDTQSEAWNFWVFGCENAQGEMQIIKSGKITFSSTAENALGFSVPVQEAIDTGMWKPRYIDITKKSS
jgi:ribosome modulation factor